MEFRLAVVEDAMRAWELINQAKAYMNRMGRCQWTDEYPSLGHIESDIANGYGYVLCLGGVPMAYGALIFTDEPVYDDIDGAWLSDMPYAVLHRLCVADEMRGCGVGAEYMRCAEALIRRRGVGSFRVDTNWDNANMLSILEKCGFAYCGDVVYPQGSRRAFEKLL